MSDEYICKTCGHRAGDHAVANRCMADGCYCADDPYLEQLDVLRKQLEIATRSNINVVREWEVVKGERDALYAKLAIAQQIFHEIEVYMGDEDVDTLQGIILTIKNKARYALKQLELK